MRTQYEWLFIDMIVTANNATILTDPDVVIYTVGIISFTCTHPITAWKSEIFFPFSALAMNDLFHVLYLNYAENYIFTEV